MNLAALVELGRRLLADTFIDAGVVSTHSTVPDGGGGSTDVWAPSRTIACRLVLAKDQALENVGGVQMGPSTTVLLCAYDTILEDLDRITINGQVYEKVAEISANSETRTLRRFIVREV